MHLMSQEFDTDKARVRHMLQIKQTGWNIPVIIHE